MNSDFPRIITLLRKERGISQKHAAADLHISQALLSHYEKGIRECGLDFLSKIADYYEVSCDYLLGRSPDPKGLTISVDEIPEEELSVNESSGTLGVIPSYNKKLISNSLNVIYSLLQKSRNKTLMKECSTVLMLSVYRVFRILFLANPKNDKNFFTVPHVMANSCAKAAEASAEAKAMAAVAEESFEGVEPGLDKDAMIVTSALLEKEYESNASSLRSLIQSSEAHIQLISKAEL